MDEQEAGGVTSDPVVKVKLGQLEFALQRPASYATQNDIVSAGGANALRAFAAALGACVPRLDKRLQVLGFERDFNVLAYGGRVIDALIAKGVPIEEIRSQGGIAYTFLVDGLIPASEVDEAEGFTGRSEGTSTS